MSVLPDVIDAWRTLVRAELDGVDVSSEPPGEDAVTTGVYLDESESTFDWQCLGDPAAQEERIRLAVVVKAYGSSTSQRDAAGYARRRAHELLDGMQRAVMNVGDSHAHQLDGTVSIARVARWRLRLAPAGDKGWLATGRVLIEATYWP